MANHRNKQKEKLLFVLGKFEHIPAVDSVEGVALEQVLRAFDQDPELFWKEWLRPLVAEGLNLDRACEIALESLLRPN